MNLKPKQLVKYRKVFSKRRSGRSGVYSLYELTIGAPFLSTARGPTSSCQCPEGRWDTQLQTFCVKRAISTGGKGAGGANIIAKMYLLLKNS